MARKKKLLYAVFYDFLQFYDCKLSTVHFGELLLPCLCTQYKVLLCMFLKLGTSQRKILSIYFESRNSKFLKKTIHQILITFSASSFSHTKSSVCVEHFKKTIVAVQHNCELSKVEAEIVD